MAIALAHEGGGEAISVSMVSHPNAVTKLVRDARGWVV
jgi:hypothetical protein